MRLNPIKKKVVYHYSKFAPYGKILKINLDNGIMYNFRARTTDKNVIKEVWAREIYSKHGFNIDESDVVFDLGGHIGVFTVLAGIKASKGKVFVFEPMLDNFEVLLSNVQLNSLTNVIAENIAVSNDNGSRVFYLSSAESSKKAGYVTGGHSFYLNKDRKEKIEVETATLKSLMKKHNIDHIDYLKLDTEGAEFDILFSASEETLKKIDKIVMELHPFENNSKEKMITFLEDHGFKNTIDKYGGEFLVYSKK